jgi:hypothetical protein
LVYGHVLCSIAKAYKTPKRRIPIGPCSTALCRRVVDSSNANSGFRFTRCPFPSYQLRAHSQNPTMRTFGRSLLSTTAAVSTPQSRIIVYRSPHTHRYAGQVTILRLYAVLGQVIFGQTSSSGVIRLYELCWTSRQASCVAGLMRRKRPDEYCIRGLRFWRFISSTRFAAIG